MKPVTLSPQSRRFGLFEAVGIELEYMIVDSASLAVRPICDSLLDRTGPSTDYGVGPSEVLCTNEIVLHVIELKTTEPVARVVDALAPMRREVSRINRVLREFGARLMPTGMHPWMEPSRETWLWSHGDVRLYRALDRVFECHGHGWSNLQSVHLQLPFASDAEFARLHSAVRLVLPLIPALAASSPIVEGVSTGLLDNRLAFYGKKYRRFPTISGEVVPEAVASESEYRYRIVDRIHRDLAPHDPSGVLRQPRVNGRGAVAHFDRGTIEIRVSDVAECPEVDLAICAAVSGLIRALAEERWSSFDRQFAFGVEPLADALRRTAEDAGDADLRDEGYLALLGLDAARLPANEAWSILLGRLFDAGLVDASAFGSTLLALLDEGSLAERILRVTVSDRSRSSLRAVYSELCDCLADGRRFEV